ncbi:MAG: protein-glutamate O-methyltransferase CheR [Candidatus Electrothrix scaldis]|nr:MAG: protein-glutamate O-methyltransferase CheR [Candidatus Electrothrix sp. GW3-3]
MDESDIEQIEINLLLDAVVQRYGYDFRHYARASIERRARSLYQSNGCRYLSEILPALLRDESFLEKIIREFSVTVTDMFRDPSVYQSIREEVVPMLRTYPYIKVWVAGCATGEEAYSIAILLMEEGLYDRSIVYGTDFNDIALEQARKGVYSLEQVETFTGNYQQAGGTDALTNYFSLAEEGHVIQERVKKNITFANHNLVTDTVFGEMHLILCRNVLIYFDKNLQKRVLDIFRDSLVFDGFFCLGSKESLRFSGLEEAMKVINENARIYQKKVL